MGGERASILVSMKVKTLEEALEFVESVNMCTAFSGKVKGVPALWDVVDLPAKGGRPDQMGGKSRGSVDVEKRTAGDLF